MKVTFMVDLALKRMLQSSQASAIFFGYTVLIMIFYVETTSLVKTNNLHLHRVKDYRSLKTGHSKSVQKTGPDHAS